MNLIRISPEYFIDIEKYNEIKIGDIIKSQIQLKREICYPTITRDSTKIKNLQPIIDLLIKYEKVGSGHSIRITHIEPPQNATIIAENYLKSTTNKNLRQSYKCNRIYLLDCIMDDQEIGEVYLTTRNIINASTMFSDIYYDYCKINYDPHYSTKAEIQKFKAFIEEYNINYEDYFVDTMGNLNNIFYCTIFDNDNIFSWANDRQLSPDKVLVQNMKELDEETSKDIKDNYIQPLIDRKIPAQYIIRIANKDYVKDKGIPPRERIFFHYAYKFIKPESFIVEADNEQQNHNKHELSRKTIEKLISKSIDFQGINYHARNASNFQDIIERIKV